MSTARAPAPFSDALVDGLVDGLATYRLVKLVRDDRITQALRNWIKSRWGPPDRSKVTYLVNCPWCLSFYFGAALTLARRQWPEASGLTARALALSALTGIATQYLDQ